MKKLTNALRDGLVRIADLFAKGETETIAAEPEVVDCYCDHGLLDFAHIGDGSGNGNWFLTEKGLGEVNLRRREQEEARAKRNRASAARAATARSLGLKRTLGGGWE